MEYANTVDCRLGPMGPALQTLKLAITRKTYCRVSLEPSMSSTYPPLFSKTLTAWYASKCIGFTIKHSRDGQTNIQLYHDDPFNNYPDAELPHLLIMPGELGVRTAHEEPIETFEVPEVMDYKGLTRVLLEQFPEELMFLNKVKG